MAGLWQLLSAWWFWIDTGALVLAVLSIPSVLLRRRARPMSTVSWILVLMSVPPLGLLLWWLFGRNHLERRRRKKVTAHQRMSARFATLRGELDAPPSAGPALLPVRRIPIELEHSVFPPTVDNAVDVLDSKDVFDVMAREIAAAKHHVHALFYIWKSDATGLAFRNLLMKKAKSGVEVRVLCDAIGSPVMATKFSRPLRKAGARIQRFFPPELFTATPRFNFRNHRKILVIDGKVGFIGGFNIADEYKHEWRDMGVRIAGPAVDQLQEIFADDWYYASNENIAEALYFGNWDVTGPQHDSACAAVASGPDTHQSPIHDALFMAINEARERIYITTPYFVPTPPITAALRAAVYRGIDVRVMVPARNDVMLVRHASRAYYPELLAVGVQIFEYQPTMLHAKTVVFDDALSMIGSANVDNRSFRLNFEASCFIGGARVNAELVTRFERDLKDCVRVQQADLDRLPWHAKLAAATAQLLSPLL